MEQHHTTLDPSQIHYIDQQSYDPHQNVQNTMMQPMHQQQDEHIYYPQNQGYNPPPVQVQPCTTVNFSSFQPDPNVLAFQGQPYPHQLTVLSQNPMPLLPTEPLPQIETQLSVPNVSEKKKTPTKQKRKSAETSPSGQMPFKKIPEYVHKILEKKHCGFTDKEFAERALSNLVRKLASQVSVLEEWYRAISEGDSNSGCVCVPRPKDGRMTITKATGNAGCKKVFPQIFVCQVFRWPNIVFHHDIKSSSHCQNPGVIKPIVNNTDKLNDSLEDTKEIICVNPFHYELTPEVEARFKKQSKGSNAAGNKSNVAAIVVPRVVKENDPVQVPVAMSSDDDEESDDEILEFKDDGIDYAKLWDEKSIKPQSTELNEIKIDDSLLKELKFFTLDKDQKKFTPTEDKYLEKLKIYQELERVIKMGEYKKLIKVEEIASKKIIEPLKVQAPIIPMQTEVKEVTVTKEASDQELMPPPAKVNSNQPTITPTIVLQNRAPTEAPPEDEDNAIQNLLDDIRGSFERQFDDEFNGFTDTAAPEDDGNSRNSSPFGNINIGPTFSMSDGHALEDLAASAEDLLASNYSSPDEMPLEGWTMSQEVFDNFLEAATSNSTDNQFNFQQQQHQGPHGQF